MSLINFFLNEKSKSNETDSIHAIDVFAEIRSVWLCIGAFFLTTDSFSASFVQFTLKAIANFPFPNEWK